MGPIVSEGDPREFRTESRSLRVCVGGTQVTAGDELHLDGMDASIVAQRLVKPSEQPLVIFVKLRGHPDQDLGVVVGRIAYQPDEMVVVGQFQLVLDDRCAAPGDFRENVRKAAVAIRFRLDQLQFHPQFSGQLAQVFGQPGCEMDRLVWPDPAQGNMV